MNADVALSQPASRPDPAEIDADRDVALAHSLHVEQMDASSATIFLTESGTRLRIPRKLYDLLCNFEKPQSIAAVAQGQERIISALLSLATRGFLVAPGQKAAISPRLLTDPPIRMFDCPARMQSGVGSDIAIVGVPYDFGDRDVAGARHGPAAIRETSLQFLYRTDRLTGIPLGWFDADSAKEILRGVTITDIGDVNVQHGEPQAVMFDRLATIIGQYIGEGCLPVTLGGDVTISFPVVRALAATQALAVVRMGERLAEDLATPSHFVGRASLKARLANLSGVLTIVEFTPEALSRSTTGHCILDDRFSELKSGVPVYLSFDLATLANIGSRRQQGPVDYSSLCALIAKVGASHPICGIDLVGLNPRWPGWGMTSMTAMHLLLQALSASKDGRHLEEAA